MCITRLQFLFYSFIYISLIFYFLLFWACFYCVVIRLHWHCGPLYLSHSYRLPFFFPKGPLGLSCPLLRVLCRKPHLLCSRWQCPWRQHSRCSSPPARSSSLSTPSSTVFPGSWKGWHRCHIYIENQLSVIKISIMLQLGQETKETVLWPCTLYAYLSPSWSHFVSVPR